MGALKPYYLAKPPETPLAQRRARMLSREEGERILAMSPRAISELLRKPAPEYIDAAVLKPSRKGVRLLGEMARSEAEAREFLTALRDIALTSEEFDGVARKELAKTAVSQNADPEAAKAAFILAERAGLAIGERIRRIIVGRLILTAPTTILSAALSVLAFGTAALALVFGRISDLIVAPIAGFSGWIALKAARAAGSRFADSIRMALTLGKRLAGYAAELRDAEIAEVLESSAWERALREGVPATPAELKKVLGDTEPKTGTNAPDAASALELTEEDIGRVLNRKKRD
ncbi:MAG: hypothetical protein QXH27_00520 [Candidatus Micrarchaeia archaeon]